MTCHVLCAAPVSKLASVVIVAAGGGGEAAGTARATGAGATATGGAPATHTRLMQYRLPAPSGRLWPRCVPLLETTSPPSRWRTLLHTT